MTTTTSGLTAAPTSPLAVLALAADLDSAAERARLVRSGSAAPDLVHHMAYTDVPALIREVLRSREALPAAYEAQRKLAAQLIGSTAAPKSPPPIAVNPEAAPDARKEAIALLTASDCAPNSGEAKELARRALKVLEAAK